MRQNCKCAGDGGESLSVFGTFQVGAGVKFDVGITSFKGWCSTDICQRLESCLRRLVLKVFVW